MEVQSRTSLERVHENLQAIETLCKNLKIHRKRASSLCERCLEFQVLKTLESSSSYLESDEMSTIAKRLLPVLESIRMRLQSVSTYNQFPRKWFYSGDVKHAIQLSCTELDEAKKLIPQPRAVVKPESEAVPRPQTRLSKKMDLPWLGVSVDNTTDLLYHLSLVPPEKRLSDDLSQKKILSEIGEVTPIPVQVVDSNIFALIIGINDYETGKKLHGAVPDALAVKDLLEKDLNVPSNRIKMLLDADASRDAIIQAFERLGKEDNGIKHGDAIFIFYAGHGAEIPAPEGWETGGVSVIQAIVPQNRNNSVHPIPDRKIGSLINGIYRTKGDNITVIFDCCHSGSGSRIDDDKIHTTRTLELDKNYRLPKDLDQDVQPASSMQTMKHVSHFLPGPLNTHVLLAACGSTERALESNDRGHFTKALLDLFKTTPPDQLSYFDALGHMEQIVGQNPQCEGVNQHRNFFNGKASSRIRNCYRVRYEPNKGYILKAGLLNDISEGAEFSVYQNAASVSQTPEAVIGKLVVDSVTPFETILTHKETVSTVPLTLGGSACALQTKAGLIEEPKLFVAFNEQFLPVFDALVELRATPNIYNFKLVNDPSLASLAVELADNGKQLAFRILDNRVLDQHNCHLPHRVPTDQKNAARVLRIAAHYYYNLNFTVPNSTTQEKVDNEHLNLLEEEKSSKVIQEVEIECWELREPSGAFDHNQPTTQVLLNNNTLTIEIDKDQNLDKAYGIKMINKTPRNLYPHVFYFDGGTLSIKRYFGSDGSGGDYKVDSPLPAGKSLTIGYGIGGGDPIDFFLPDGQEVDVGFLKFVFSTKPVDLSHVECDSPFEEEDPRASRRIQSSQKDGWGSILIPVVVKSKGVS